MGLSGVAGGGSQLGARWAGVYMCVGKAVMGLENSLNLGFKLAWVHSQLSEVLAV